MAEVLGIGCTHAPMILNPAEQWETRNALIRRRIPPQLRAYLGRPA